MKFEELALFIEKRMMMAHVYQPVMLITLLKSQGVCSTKEIAMAILPYDQSQIDYYIQITNNMVGRILRKHGIVKKEGKTYLLNDFDKLNHEQVEYLVSLCEQRLDDFIQKRGLTIWQHRRIVEWEYLNSIE